MLRGGSMAAQMEGWMAVQWGMLKAAQKVQRTVAWTVGCLVGKSVLRKVEKSVRCLVGQKEHWMVERTVHCSAEWMVCQKAELLAQY